MVVQVLSPPIPSNPQIVSKEIATETDEEGKLAVKIKVEAQNK